MTQATPSHESAPEQVEHWASVSVLGMTYEVSSLGAVVNPRTGRTLTQTLRRDGYRTVTIQVGRRRKCLLVHGMMAEAFIGPRPPGKLVRHLDGTRRNAASNLAYGTHQQNSDDAKLHGVVAFGIKNGQSRLTEKTVVALRQIGDLMPARLLAKYLRVSTDIVNKVRRLETWPHVSGEMTTDDALRHIFRSGKTTQHHAGAPIIAQFAAQARREKLA